MNIDTLLEASGQTYSTASLSAREASAHRTQREHTYTEVDRGIQRRHGTRSCYVGGCRRPECIEANRAYMRRWFKEHR